MNSKPNIILLVGVLGLIALVIIVAMLANTRPSSGFDVTKLFSDATGQGTPEAASGVPRVSSADHVRGSVDAKVVWIEYGDFDCPFCERHHGEIKKLLEAYPDDVQVVFRHFPLDIHPDAYEKAVASECIAEIGGEAAFWKAHDLFFEASTENIGAIALRAGVDSEQVLDCIASGITEARVDGDLATGAAAGITGTPTTMIVAPDGSGSLIPGAIPFETMKEIMNYLLNEYAGASS